MWASTSARTSSRSSPSIVSSQSGYTFEQTNSKRCTNHLSIFDFRRSYPTLTLAYMEDLRVGRYTIPAHELEESFDTSGGPGGQHANRSATAVRLRLDIGGSSLPDEVRSKLRERLGDHIEVVAADSRSQYRNRALARRRMAERITKALVEPPTRRQTRPTRASQRRRLEWKRARARTKRLRKPPDVDV